MIKDLNIINVQSHVDTSFEFVPGINVIRGPSDVGKSVVVRTLKWVAENKPSGDILRRHKTKKSIATLDGVTKVKSASKHFYQVGDNTFKALRTSVPEEIQDILRLSDINFQEQHDAYFLLADSPGHRAKVLNKVADLEIIDQSLQLSKSKVRAAKSKFDTTEELLTEKVQAVDDLQWVTQLDKDWQVIEALQVKIADRRALLTKLRTMIDEVDRHKAIVESFPDTTGDVEKIDGLYEKLNTSKLDNLRSLIHQVAENKVNFPSGIADDIGKINDWLQGEYKHTPEELRGLVSDFEQAKSEVEDFPSDIRDDILKLEDFNQRGGDLKVNLKHVEDLVNDFVIKEDQAKHANQVYEEGKVKFDEALKEARVCPFCERSTL